MKESLLTNIVITYGNKTQVEKKSHRTYQYFSQAACDVLSDAPFMHGDKKKTGPIFQCASLRKLPFKYMKIQTQLLVIF